MAVILNYLVRLAVYCILAFIIYLPTRLIYLKRKKIKPNITHEIILVLFVCWTVGIISQTLFPVIYVDYYKGLEITMIFPSANFLQITKDGCAYNGSNEIVRTLNLVPFKTVFEYLSATDTNGVYSESTWQTFSVANLLGNLLLFVPFGFLLPCAVKRYQKLKNTLLAGVLFVFLIETVQYFIGRAADIDDFIINVAGILIGYLAFYILSKISEHIRKKA